MIHLSPLYIPFIPCNIISFVVESSEVLAGKLLVRFCSFTAHWELFKTNLGVIKHARSELLLFCYRLFYIF